MSLLTPTRRRPPSLARGGSALLQAGLTMLSIAASILLAGISFLLHFNLSTAGSLELLLVVLVALQWRFLQASAVSITGVFCLNFLFTLPLFQLSVADPNNWISLVTFEATALLVSGLSAKVRSHAAAVELERSRNAKLYELSRAVLLVDGQKSTITQLSALIQELLQVEAVDFWLVHHIDGGSASHSGISERSAAHQAYLSGQDSDDPKLGVSERILRIGTTPIGAIALRGWRNDPLLADAVASLAAVAVERTRALQKENRAEAQRNTEQLRTAVLDGLAHGFKTPLTAIQTASSGLLAIDRLSPTQAELVSIIDEQASVLGKMTTRLLQTAALEAKEIRLRRTEVSLFSLIHDLLEQQDQHIRDRVRVVVRPEITAVAVDAHLVQLAIAQLIDNAAKYSPVDREIDIALIQNEYETIVTVANEGSSIRPEEQERIFERFYRGIESGRGPAGTGLGLSIVKKTADAHGGRAWVDCKENVICFSLAIPNFPHLQGAKNE